MGLEDAIPNHCPYCRRSDLLVRAIDVRWDEGGADAGSMDVALPGYETWSGLVVCAIGLILLSALASGASAPTDADGFLPITLMGVGLLVGALGAVRTLLNRGRMRAVEADVRRYHEAAMYCEYCARVHFPPRRVPPGVAARVAWTVPDYRRELWYACGFAKAGLRIRQLRL